MMKLPDLPELELADAAMVYRGGRRIGYEDIEAIVFELLPLLQNRLARAFYGFDVQMPFGSSSNSPKLAVHLSDGEVIWVSRGWDFVVSNARAEAVCTAAEFLSDKTFDQRFEKYRKALEKSDRYSYGKYQFCKNGDVLKSGKRLCNVRDRHVDVLLGPFHIHFEQKQTFLQRLRSLLGLLGETIVISKDRDCFLSMFRLLYGVYWEDEQYRDYPHSELSIGAN